MQETHKPLSRPLSRGDTPQLQQAKYELVKLPNEQWRRSGEALVLSPHVRKLLLRYGLYRLHFGAIDGSYGLLMLSGPPGTGKSDSARWTGDAVVRALRASGNGLVINAPALFDEHLGKSAKLVAALLEEITLSARRSVTVVLWEDVESLFIGRRQSVASNDPTDVMRVTTTLLHGLDRLRYEAQVLQIGTLNIAGVIDEAIASRADLTVPFALPDFAARFAILKKKVQGLAGEQVLSALTTATEGWSGRDLNRITMLAFLHGTGPTPEDLTAEDFLRAVGLKPDSEVPHEGNHELKEENPSWTKSSNNGFQAEVSPRKNKLIWPLRLFERQPNSWNFPPLTKLRTRLTP